MKSSYTMEKQIRRNIALKNANKRILKRKNSVEWK